VNISISGYQDFMHNLHKCNGNGNEISKIYEPEKEEVKEAIEIAEAVKN